MPRTFAARIQESLQSCLDADPVPYVELVLAVRQKAKDKDTVVRMTPCYKRAYRKHGLLAGGDLSQGGLRIAQPVVHFIMAMELPKGWTGQVDWEVPEPKANIGALKRLLNQDDDAASNEVRAAELAGCLVAR